MRVACQIGHQNLGNGKNPYGRCCGTQGFLGATYMPVTAKRAYSAHAGCATLSLENGAFGANALFRARTRAVQNLPRQTRAAIPPPCGCAGRWTANPKAPLLHQPFRFFWQPLIYMGTAKKKGPTSAWTAKAAATTGRGTVFCTSTKKPSFSDGQSKSCAGAPPVRAQKQPHHSRRTERKTKNTFQSPLIRALKMWSPKASQRKRFARQTFPFWHRHTRPAKKPPLFPTTIFQLPGPCVCFCAHLRSLALGLITCCVRPNALADISTTQSAAMANPAGERARSQKKITQTTPKLTKKLSNR